MGERYEVVLPDLGLGDRTARVGMWLVRRGERVTQGETLLEIVAENVMIEFPAQRSGRVLKKLVADDERLAPGQRLAIIETEE